MRTLLVPATVHGRVLVRDSPARRGLLLGFHGYMETAEIQMARLESVPGADAWTLVSVQGLHRFYRGRSQDVVASWMTRQDRDAAVAENIEYVSRVIETIGGTDQRVVCAGFSQGVAMAFRAGVRSVTTAAGVIAVGGDVPPELLADTSATFPARVLLARGESDDWYTDAKLQADVSALTARGSVPETLVYPAGHEWTPEVSSRIGSFLASIPHAQRMSR